MYEKFFVVIKLFDFLNDGILFWCIVYWFDVGLEVWCIGVVGYWNNNFDVVCCIVVFELCFGFEYVFYLWFIVWFDNIFDLDEWFDLGVEMIWYEFKFFVRGDEVDGLVVFEMW